MNLGTRAASIIKILRPVDTDKVILSGLFSEQTMTIFRACTMVAELAQQAFDIHGRDEQARLAREIVKRSADCKVNLTKLMTKQLTKAQIDRLTVRVVTDYAEMKSATGKLFPQIDPYWGRSIPQLL